MRTMNVTIAALMFGFAACGGGSETSGPPTPVPNPVKTVASVTLTAITVDSGATVSQDPAITLAGTGAVPTLTAAFSSSDTTVATVRPGSGTTVQITGRKGGTATLIATINGQSASAPITVRPDRNFITRYALLFDAPVLATAGSSTRNREVVMLPAATDTLINLTFDPQPDSDPRWSPTGATIVYSHRDPGFLVAPWLFSRAAPVGASRRMFSWSDDGAVAVHPVTGALSVIRKEAFPDTGSTVASDGLYTADASGSSLTRLAPISALDLSGFSRSSPYSIATTPTRVAYLSFAGKAIVVANFSATPSPRAIAIPCTFECSTLRWSPDDSRIAFVADGAIWIIELSGGAAVRIATTDASDPLAWSPSGDELVYRNSERLRVVNRVTLQSVVLDSAQTYGGPAAWSPDGRLIAYLGADFNLPRMRIVRRSDGAWRYASRQQVVDFGTGFAGNISWSPR